MIEARQNEDVEPLCGHCGQSLREVWFRELRGLLGRRYIYFCNHCHKVLGVSHRKGFWMG